MCANSSSPIIPLPRDWSSRVPSAVLSVIGLAQLRMAYTRGWAANSISARVRLKAQLDRAHELISLLREERRIKDARMAQRAPPALRAAIAVAAGLAMCSAMGIGPRTSRRKADA